MAASGARRLEEVFRRLAQGVGPTSMARVHRHLFVLQSLVPVLLTDDRGAHYVNLLRIHRLNRLGALRLGVL